MLTSPRKPFARFLLAELLVLLALPAARGQQSEPPALNPFGSRAEREDQKRDDAVPGFVEMSDGKVHPGQVMLTRDARLKVFDEQQKKHREIPLKAIKRIDCTVQKEWVEEEWRFKESSSCVSGGYSKMHERRGIIPSLEPGFGGWFLTN